MQIRIANELSISKEQGTLEAVVRNDSNSEKPFQAIFFAPLRYSIQAPSKIPGNSEATVKIVLENFPSLYNTVYETRFQATLGNENALQKVLVSFQEPKSESKQPSVQPKPTDQNATTAIQKQLLSGFLTFFKSTNFEMALQVLLGILIIVLCVALMARVYNRGKGE